MTEASLNEAGGPHLEGAGSLEKLFSKFDLEVVDEKSSTLLLTSKKPIHRKRKGSFIFPVEKIGVLAEQVKGGPRALSEHYGYFTSDGYFELILARIRAGTRYTFENPDRARYSSLSSADVNCSHNSDPFPVVGSAEVLEELTPDIASINESGNREDYADSARRLGSRIAKSRLHLHDENENCCIELSCASPCGILFGVPSLYPNLRELGYRFDGVTTLKIQMDTTRCRGDFLKKAHDLANAFLYELSVRNGIRYDPVYRPGVNDGLPLRRSERADVVRFPRIKIPAEVAQLYAFGESAEQNPPLAFLSFYQVLEYYFPRAAKRITIRDLKKELVNPRFGGTDDDFVRLIGIAERGQSASEDKQIKLLLESINEECIREFFEDDERVTHFGSGGPIQGVNQINLKNTKDPLINHVASRIYALRNRIVHAKDDPKYQSKILLPRSREATLMRPDVDLVKFLAQQVIVDSQV